MIHDLEYFVTVVVIPHAKLERARLFKLIDNNDRVIGIRFVTNKDGVVALTLANATDTVIITFEEESTANHRLDGSKRGVSTWSVLRRSFPDLIHTESM